MMMFLVFAIGLPLSAEAYALPDVIGGIHASIASRKDRVVQQRAATR